MTAMGIREVVSLLASALLAVEGGQLWKTVFVLDEFFFLLIKKSHFSKLCFPAQSANKESGFLLCGRGRPGVKPDLGHS